MQRHIDAEHGRITGTNDPEHDAIRVDDRDRHARRRAQWLPDLRARTIGKLHRTGKNLLNFRSRQCLSTVGAGLRGETLYVQRIDQYNSIEARKVQRIGAYTR